MYSRIFTFTFSSVAVLLCLVTVFAYGQTGSTTGAIKGSVLDGQQAAIAGATIILRNQQTDETRELHTNESGDYTLLQLVPGRYELIVSAEGFSERREIINVVLGTTTSFETVLTVTNTKDAVIVNGHRAFFEDRTESSTNILQNEIDALPINRRNFLDFSVTAARVVPDGRAIAATATSGLSINGQSGRFNNIAIDGLDNNDSGSGSVRATFSQDAVQEFQIISNGYSAEFGRALGGTINIVTRGGGNNYHGTLFSFNRSDNTSARDPFSITNPPYMQYQFGVVLSGVIKKDKAFFFTSFERLSIKQNTIVSISDMVVAAAKRQGFVNVQNGPVPFSIGTTTLLSRLDFQPNPQNKLFIRYNGGFSFNSGFDTYGGLIDYTNGNRQVLDDNTVAVNNTYINPSLNLVNETRFLFTKRIQDIFSSEPGPQVRLTTAEGVNAFGRSTVSPQPRNQRFYQIVNNVSLIKKNQEIKFGGDLFITAPPEGKTALPFFPGGLATFSLLNFTVLTGIPNLPSFTGLEAFDPSLRTPAQKSFLTALAALLPNLVAGFPRNLPLANLSLPTVYIQGFGDPNLAVNAKSFNVFVQDNIKLRNNLLIKAGVRYDLNRSDFIPNNNGNFSPRVAFSYNPSKLSNVRVHGSYGLFFSVPTTGVAVNINLLGTGRLKVPVIPFPFSILPFSLPGHKFPDSFTLPSSVNFVPQLSQITKYAPNLRESYTQQINFGINYLLKNNTLVSVDYDFVRGIKLFSTRNINPVVRPTNSVTDSLVKGRVDPSQGDILEFSSSFDSYYHAFTLAITKKFDERVNLLASYTFSKIIDNARDFAVISRETVDPLNIRQERSLGEFDIRSRFVLSGVWNLDYRKNLLLTGLQVSSIVTLASGKPYNLLAGIDLNRNFDNPAGDRPLQGGVSIGRNTGITPGFANIDLRLTKSFKVKDKYKINFYIETFNLFNRVNIDSATVSRTFLPDSQGRFNLPAKEKGRFIVSPDRYVSALAPRQLQFGIRASF